MLNSWYNVNFQIGNWKKKVESIYIFEKKKKKFAETDTSTQKK